jgi:ABC-type dipeptide/oligopeptide/nickel transport system permease subunit
MERGSDPKWGLPPTAKRMDFPTISDDEDLILRGIAVAVMLTPTFARLVHGSALSILERDHVAASRALGASAFRVIFGQVLPNPLSPLVVASTLDLELQSSWGWSP